MNDIEELWATGLARLAGAVHSTPPPVGTVMHKGADAQRRPRTRVIAAGAIVATITAGTGVAIATGVFNESIEDNFVKMAAASPCSDDPRDLRLVAAATDQAGWSLEFWVVESGQDGVFTVQRGPDGQPAGSSLACNPGPAEISQSPDEASVGGFYPSYERSPHPNQKRATSIQLYGKLPTTAVSAEVTFDDGTTSPINPGRDGFFVQMVENPERATRRATAIDLFDANGNIIGHQTLDHN
jgi:hypothetical protein